MNRFEGQVAIVTGGARGIGEGIANRLAEEGASVILFDLIESNLEDTIQEMNRKGLSLNYKNLNISNEPEVKNAIKEVVSEHGKIDIMVNSAGIVGLTATKITDYSYDTFQEVVKVNLHGSFLMTKYVLPSMLERNYGRILLISSIGGKEGNPGMAGYVASKSGVIGLVKGVGKEYAETGITINGLAPAVIATEMNQNTDPEMLNYMVKKIPMGRLGTVEEIAALSSWIVSKEAAFNTGFIFDLSGGRATY